MRYRQSVLLALAVLALSTLVFAQTGSISGTITDSTGAVIAGAEVTARNTGSNASRASVSSASGAFSITQLDVGTYEITVKKDGFKSFHVPAIELTVAQAMTVNAKLMAGAVSESVEVRADQAQAIDLETSQLSNLVDSRQMQDLPLITRDPYSLVLLSPETP